MADAVGAGPGRRALTSSARSSLGDWHEDHSDIDIVAITAEPATEEDGSQIRLLHALLAEHQPRPFVDGPYLAWGDLVVPPSTGLYRPWSLDGVAHHDGECFEINPITWYTLATYGVTGAGHCANGWAPCSTRRSASASSSTTCTATGRTWRRRSPRCSPPSPIVVTGEMLEWCRWAPAAALHRAHRRRDVQARRRRARPVGRPERSFHDTIRAGLALRAGEPATVSAALLLDAADLLPGASPRQTRAA